METGGKQQVTQHTHVLNISNFQGKFIDAYRIGMDEGKDFFQLCDHHAVDALKVEVHTNRGTFVGEGHVTAASIIVTYDDGEDDFSDTDPCLDDDPDSSSSGLYLKDLFPGEFTNGLTQAFKPPF
jgi:hypothetical protein